MTTNPESAADDAPQRDNPYARTGPLSDPAGMRWGTAILATVMGAVTFASALFTIIAFLFGLATSMGAARRPDLLDLPEFLDDELGLAGAAIAIVTAVTVALMLAWYTAHRVLRSGEKSRLIDQRQERLNSEVLEYRRRLAREPREPSETSAATGSD